MAASSSGDGQGERRRALVTGASVGLGAAFAERLAAEGYALVLVARGRDQMEALAARLRDRHRAEVDVRAADLTEPRELRAIEEIVADDPRLELLVNNAGFGTAGRFAELDPGREEAEIQLNIVALVRLARAALPGMIARRRGGIINVSSLAGFQPAPYNATYAATKAFVTSFTEALHEELRGTGVRVQALCPGFTRTEFQARAQIDTSSIPAFAWMSAEAVVDAALAGLRRGGVICVPGLANRAFATVLGQLPRSVVRRVAGVTGKRLAG